MKHASVLVGAVLTASAVCVPIASAHDYPVSSSPAASQTLTRQPGRVSVTFDDFVLSKPAPPDLVVVGPDGRHYESGCATVTNRTVSAATALGPDGKYTATWRVVSADGHPVSGSTAFTFKAASAVKRSPGRTEGPKCAENAQNPSASSGSSSRGPVIAAGFAGIGALLGVTVLLIRSRRRPPAPEEDDE